MRESRARHRELMQQGLTACLDDLPAGSGELVRAQVDTSDPAEYETAALACLAAAEAVGGSAEAAVPGAVSLAFISQMGHVFAGLESSGGSASLSTAWGMPRSLNAGDAMFALAQETILSASNELTAEDRLEALGWLDRASRNLGEALHAARPDAGAETTQRVLLPAALALGSLLGGAGNEVRQRLAELGREWTALPEEELARNLAGDPRSWLAT
jgi:hypothetical protein